jgi:hypothetical protein
MDNGGRWVRTGSYCKWCGGEIKVWVSDYDDSGEFGDEADFCSIMCSFEALNFMMLHR